MSEVQVHDVGGAPTGDDDLVAQIRDMVIADATESEDSYATEPIQVAMPSPNPETHDFSTSQDFMDSWPRPRPDL